jgi:release factor glutamine methyltransferase
MKLSEVKNKYFTKLDTLYSSSEIGMLYRLAVEEVFGYNFTRIVQSQFEINNNSKIDKVFNILNRLAAGEPLQYILKKAWFYELEFKVGPGVLIPRQETELLVDYLIKHPILKSSKKILDIGTGSGCIAITLKKHLPQSKVFAIDTSNIAIEIARQNAVKNNVKIEIFNSDIFNMSKTSKYDVVVSNPPYVCRSEQNQMHKNVIDFEPAEALFVDDNHPLVFYDAIFKFCRDSLNPSGLLAFEINEQFGKEVKELFRTEGYSDILLIKDLNNKNRIVTGKKQ